MPLAHGCTRPRAATTPFSALPSAARSVWTGTKRPDPASTTTAPATAQYRRSWNNKFTFIMQKDGNAVLYQGKTALWSTATNVKGSSISLQRDGNLVIYSGRTPVWSTGTAGR
ncbi:hypothetical protein ACQPXM_03060 [Kribbella sp. CA-253562]|uniref:hypothetical protein n=1 Tax=Kribbella sp. CA-253562 TaxID=3239942 RepID=UPI003D927015